MFRFLALVSILTSATAAVATAPLSANPASTQAKSAVPVPKPVPRLVDVGSSTCIPCRVMLGVLEELRAGYPTSLKVEFVNMKDDSGAAERFGVRTIPTQIFYAPDGKELWRHVGVIRAGDIVAKFAELGYRLEPAKKGP